MRVPKFTKALTIMISQKTYEKLKTQADESEISVAERVRVLIDAVIDNDNSTSKYDLNKNIKW